MPRSPSARACPPRSCAAARRGPDRRAAMRLLAIANALGGLSRAEAARLPAWSGRPPGRGGPLQRRGAGWAARPPPLGPAEALSPQAASGAQGWVLRGPTSSGTGSARGAWSSAPTLSRPTARATAAGACRGCSSGSGSRGRRPGLGTAGQRGRAGRVRKELGPKLAAIAAAHPDQRLQLWCEDEARVGQKGRTCHHAGTNAGCARRARRQAVREPLPVRRLPSGHRPGLRPRPARGDRHMHEPVLGGLRRAARAWRPRRADPGPGGLAWSRRPTVPGNITLLPLPACSPELNPGRAGLAPPARRFLSHRVLDGYTAVLDAACRLERPRRRAGRLSPA